MKKKTSTPQRPPSLLTIATAESPRILLDESVMEAVAHKHNLYEEMFPLRRALDPSVVDRLLRDGILSAEDVRPALLTVEGAQP